VTACAKSAWHPTPTRARTRARPSSRREGNRPLRAPSKWSSPTSNFTAKGVERQAPIQDMIVAIPRGSVEGARQCAIPARDFIGSSKRWAACRHDCLIDPPLHEFVPHEDKQTELAKALGLPRGSCHAPCGEITRSQPHARPSRLPPGDHLPEFWKMAGARHHEAAIAMAKAKRLKVIPEIMISAHADRQKREMAILARHAQS